MRTIDLQGLYEAFLKETVKKYPDKFPTAEALEANIGKLAKKWESLPFKVLGGLTPSGYVAKLRESKEFFDYVETCLEKGWEVADIVCGELADDKEAVGFLKPFLTSNLKDAPEFAAAILKEIGGDDVENIFLEAVINDNYPASVKETAYEYLSEDCPSIVDKILEQINGVSDAAQAELVEILSNYKGNKAVFYWLVTMLYRATDVPLYAGLLGKYGDENAIDILKSFAKDNDIDYVEYVEIRAAVERLGGVFDVEKDFSNDPLRKYVHEFSENGGADEQE